MDKGERAMKTGRVFSARRRPQSCEPAHVQTALFSSSSRAGAGRMAGLLAATLFLTGVLKAQQKTAEDQAQDSGMVLQQTVRRVRVDVVVTDAQGRPVPGLEAKDFQVAENGKQQPVHRFEWHDGSADETPIPKLPPLPVGTFMNLPTAPERGPLTVLLYDVLNTPLKDQLNARAQMVEFLKNEGRRMAIFVLGKDLHIVQGFTADTSLLARAVVAIHPARTSLAADGLLSDRDPTQSLAIPAPPLPGRSNGSSGAPPVAGFSALRSDALRPHPKPNRSSTSCSRTRRPAQPASCSTGAWS